MVYYLLKILKINKNILTVNGKWRHLTTKNQSKRINHFETTVTKYTQTQQQQNQINIYNK